MSAIDPKSRVAGAESSRKLLQVLLLFTPSSPTRLNWTEYSLIVARKSPALSADVLYRLVMMSIAPGEDIGEEVHQDGDQFFRIEEGHGLVTIDGRESKITDGDGIVVPAGARHNIKNVGEEPLRLYTLYAPPHHRNGYVAATRADAQNSQEEFDGTTTE